MSKYCRYCGHALKATSKFCPSCGRTVPSQAASTPQQPTIQQPQQQPAPQNTGMPSSQAMPPQAQPMQQPQYGAAPPMGFQQPQQHPQQQFQQQAWQPQQQPRQQRQPQQFQQQPQQQPQQFQQQQRPQFPQPQQLQMPKIFSVKAPDLEGEILIGEETVQDALPGVSGLADALPFQIPPVGASISSAFKGLGSGIKAMFTGKNPKALIFAIVLALVWAAQFFIMELGGVGIIGRFLEWFTFARGGYASNPLLIAGGILGKGVVAAAFFSLISGGFKDISAGARSIFSKGALSGGNIGFLLVGAGVALCLYQVFAGYAALNDTMAAIAGAVLALRAAGSQAGGLFGIVRSATAVKMPGGARQDAPNRIAAVFAGAATGFALAVPVSAIPFSWTPAIIGGIALVIGIVLCLASRPKPGPAVPAAMMVLLLVFPLFSLANPAVADDGERSGEIYTIIDGRRDPYSEAVLNYDIKGGTEFEFGWDSNWANWSGSVFAQPGDTITVSYSTSGYPTTDQLDNSIQFYHNLSSYDVSYKSWEQVYYYPAEGDYERVYITNETHHPSGTSPNASGTVSFTVPSYEQIKKDGVGYELIHGNYKFSINVGETLKIANKSRSDDISGRELYLTLDVFVPKSDDEVVTVNASPFSGDMDVNIPMTIMRDFLAVAAALAGAGAASGISGSTASSTRNRRKREEDPIVGYKMYATKSFGNGIRKGAPAVEVQARIEQIRKSGKRELMMGQAHNMVAKGTHLKVSSEAGPYGNFLRAFVSADANEQSDEGTLSFIYQVQAKFTCNIVFKLTGMPKITFPQVRKEGEDAVLDIIGGDGLVYAPLMVFEEAIGEPTVLRFRTPDDLVVRSREVDPAEAKAYPGVVYHMIVYNRTDMLTQDQIISNGLPRRMIGVHAEFENGDVVEGKLLVKVFPEGLSVESDAAYDNKLIVPTAPLPSAPPDSLKPTVFSVNVALPDPDVARMHFRGKGEVPEGLTELTLVPPDLAEVEFGELGKIEEYGEMFTTNFDYELGLQRAHLGGEGAYEFAPKNPLPQPDDPYEGETVLSCFYRGRRMELALPLEFTGDSPEVPHGWQEEVDKLRRTVKFYGLGSNQYFRTFIQHINAHTPNEISMFRYEVIKEARDFYYEQSRALLEAGDTLAVLENSAAFFEWAGDQAFTVLVYYWVGTRISPQAAPYVDAVVSPIKQVWAHMTGAYIGALLAGEMGSFSDDEIFASAGVIAENVLLEVIESSVKSTFAAANLANLKKLGALIACYLMVSWIKHYTCGDKGEKGDVYKSLVAAGCDLGAGFIKKAVSNTFKKMVSGAANTNFQYTEGGLSRGTGIGNAPFWDKLSLWFHQALAASDKFFQATDGLKTADAVENYLSATCGFVGMKIFEAATAPSAPPAGHVRMEFDGVVADVPVKENSEVFADVFVDSHMKEFTDLGANSQQVNTVPDYMVVKKQGFSGLPMNFNR